MQLSVSQFGLSTLWADVGWTLSELASSRPMSQTPNLYPMAIQRTGTFAVLTAAAVPTVI